MDAILIGFAANGKDINILSDNFAIIQTSQRTMNAFDTRLIPRIKNKKKLEFGKLHLNFFEKNGPVIFLNRGLGFAFADKKLKIETQI